jgi:hypothetical protein
VNHYLGDNRVQFDYFQALGVKCLAF